MLWKRLEFFQQTIFKIFVLSVLLSAHIKKFSFSCFRDIYYLPDFIDLSYYIKSKPKLLVSFHQIILLNVVFYSVYTSPCGQYREFQVGWGTALWSSLCSKKGWPVCCLCPSCLEGREQCSCRLRASAACTSQHQHPHCSASPLLGKGSKKKRQNIHFWWIRGGSSKVDKRWEGGVAVGG